MPKITELTKEQEERMHEFAKERIAIQLSTVSTPETEAEAEKNLRLAYEAEGLDGDGVKIVWKDSPIAAMEDLKKHLHVVDSVMNDAWFSIWDYIWDSVGNSFANEVWFFVWGSVGNSVGDPIQNAIRDYIEDSVMEAARGVFIHFVSDLSQNCIRAYHDADAFAYYGFFSEILGPNKLQYLDRVNQLVSGYGLYRHEAILIRKPKLLTLDENGKLHNEVQKCIEYRDGWGFYAWHGTRVPEYVITTPKEQITKDMWLKEKNTEVRRCIIEKVGYDTFLSWFPHKTLDKCRDYELIQCNEEVDGEPLRLLKMVCPSTGRIFFERVPINKWVNEKGEIEKGEIDTCLKAVAWQFGKEVEDYKPEEES